MLMVQQSILISAITGNPYVNVMTTANGYSMKLKLFADNRQTNKNGNSFRDSFIESPSNLVSFNRSSGVLAKYIKSE